MDVGLVALAVGALLAAGIGASLLAGRLRLPGLVLVLVLGMVIGSDGLEWINFGATTPTTTSRRTRRSWRSR